MDLNKTSEVVGRGALEGLSFPMRLQLTWSLPQTEAPPNVQRTKPTLFRKIPTMAFQTISTVQRPFRLQHCKQVCLIARGLPPGRSLELVVKCGQQ